jgi:hypothetical protein
MHPRSTAANGLSLIGLPAENLPEAEPDSSVAFLPAPQNGVLNYDPMTASYRTDEIMGNTAFRR